MKKFAFFVEGQTEAIFTKKLIAQIAGSKGLQIEINDSPSYISFSRITSPHNDTENYILIFNCEQDEAVKQKIKDNQGNLIKSGYCSIIGIRDLYPLSRDELESLRESLHIGLSTDIPVSIIISIMEIEAWFIQEYKHFTSLNNILTPQFIEENTGFNPELGDASIIDRPAMFLNDVYQLAGLKYKKRLYQVHLTTDHIDYEEMYLVTRHKKQDINEFINEIESALE